MRLLLLIVSFICSSFAIKSSASELCDRKCKGSLASIYTTLFNTEHQAESAYKLELRNRFENGYIAGPGFSDDISKAIDDATIFRANPSEFRPTFGAVNDIINSGQILHTSAVFLLKYWRSLKPTTYTHSFGEMLLQTILDGIAVLLTAGFKPLKREN